MPTWGESTEKTYHHSRPRPVGSKTDLIAFRDMLIAVREKVAGLEEAGEILGRCSPPLPPPPTMPSGAVS